MAALQPSVPISQWFNMNNTRSLKLNGIQPSLTETFTCVFPNETCQHIFYKRGSIGQKHNFLKSVKKQSYPADFLQLHSEENKQLYFYELCVGIQSASRFEGFLEFLHEGDGEEETRAGGAGGQRAATPCWWFIRHTKICFTLWDQPWKTPHTHCDSLPFFSVFAPAVQLHTHCPPEEHSLCRRGTAQYGVVSPAAHVIKGWKSTDTRSDRSVPKTVDVTCLCKLLLSGKRCEGGKGPWKWTAWGRSGLGTFPGLLNGIWLFSDSWCKYLHPATTKLQTETNKLVLNTQIQTKWKRANTVCRSRLNYTVLQRAWHGS